MSRRERPSPPIIVGISGGTGAGKSWLANYLRDGLEGQATVLCLDWYYKDRSGLTREECHRFNPDHPSALDMPLFQRHLRTLAAGRSIEVPQYDYATHRRTGETQTVDPAPVTIVEGLLLFHRASVRKYFDISVFIHVPSDVRLMRRLRRDKTVRRVETEETLRLYERFIRPMHQRFVGPSAEYATWLWHQLEDMRFPSELLRELQFRLKRREH